MSKDAYIQLGVIIFLIVFGLYLSNFPPKKINSFYGYRTQRSMKSQASWDEGNKYAGKIIAIICAVWLLVQIAAIVAFKSNQTVLVVLFLSVLIIFSIAVILITENHLKAIFEKN